MIPKRKKVTGKDRERLSNAQTLFNRQSVEVLLAPPFLPAGHPHLVFISVKLR